MARIWATSAEIIRRDDEGSPRLPTATLDRASGLSTLLWKEVQLLPLAGIPLLQEPLTMYELILVDIQQILSSNNSLEVSDGAIDRRLDDFMFQFQEALDLLESTISQRSTPSSAHFFQNAHDIIISGGNFSSLSTTTSVIHDPIVREQSHRILQLVYIQCGVLFGRAGHSDLPKILGVQ